MSAKGDSGKSRMPRLVWTLASAGLGSGMVALFIVHHALSRIRDERGQAEITQTRLARSVTALRAERMAVFRDIEAHLNRDQREGRTEARSPDRLVPLVRECKNGLITAGLQRVAAIEKLDRSFGSLIALYEDVEQWESQTERIRREWTDTWKRAQQAVREALSAAQKLEGRRRLRRGVLLRRYRVADSEEATRLAVTIVDELDSDQGLAMLKAELSDLALLAEHLRGETEIDNLVSLKDNQMRQTLARLRRAAEKVGGRDQGTLAPLIVTLQVALFGEGTRDDADHQTLVVGQGGLYSLQRERLLVEADGRSLRGAVSNSLEECLEAERALNDAVSHLTEAAAARAQTTLRAAWRNALLTGLVVAAIFLLLAKRIATLGRQAEAQLRETSASLRESHGATLGLLEDAEAARQRIEEQNAANQTLAQHAQMATQAKSEFLANMSHEIRTPMTAILGFAENLLEHDQSETERLNCVNTIRRNGEYLLGLINDILDLSKIEAGKMTIERTVCSPCRIVAEVSSLMRVRADSKDLPLMVEYTGAIPETIRSDPVRLRQIIINLLGNAVKFTEVGSVRLVTTLVERDDEPRLQFDVIDTGRGMSREQTDKLFQPFSQADASTTRQYGGTGLGLTISKRFAEMLGGDLCVVASREGVGTTIRATVATGPLDDVKMIADPMSATVVEESDRPDTPVERSDLQGCRILLAEDGPDNQRLIAHVLKKAGADVTVYENGKLTAEAALAARSAGEPFDCILMDMQMPVMDGYEATGLLRAEGYAGLIIALTAHAMAGDREKCLQAGCDAYASKPVNRRELIETIRKQLQRATASADAS